MFSATVTPPLTAVAVRVTFLAAYNYIGKSSYALNGDVYLKKTLVDEFRVYNVALADTSINKFVAILPQYNIAVTTAQINSVLATLGFADGQKIISNLTLPTSINGVSISWNSSDDKHHLNNR